jgi:transposase
MHENRSFPDFRRKNRSIRQLAVKAVLAGQKPVEVAKIFGVSRNTIGRGVTAYRDGGLSALQGKPRGRPKGGALLPWQAAQIAKAVVDYHPEQLKLPFYL